MLGLLDKAIDVAIKRGLERAPQLAGDTIAHRAVNAATVISVVVIGIVALVGILIYSQVNEAIPDDVLMDGEDPTELGESRDALTEGFGGAMELVPIVLLVLIAALVIGVVQRMR